MRPPTAIGGQAGIGRDRPCGVAALGLAYTACGQFDLFVHHVLYPWDIAAGILLVQEAAVVFSR